ncbi:MAG: GNAT family N-acetyltransferase [Oscillospiraceae bacterium]
MNDYKVTRLIDAPELKQPLAQWMHDKWYVPTEAYLESMEECLNGAAVPQWYRVIDNGQIIGGPGVIENDFHERKDLAPNVCAVFVEEAFRCRGIAGTLLNFVCDDMKTHGIDTLYLVTDHTSFYERYGWEFYCSVKADGGETSRLYIHK